MVHTNGPEFPASIETIKDPNAIFGKVEISARYGQPILKLVDGVGDTYDIGKQEYIKGHIFQPQKWEDLQTVMDTMSKNSPENSISLRLDLSVLTPHIPFEETSFYLSWNNSYDLNQVLESGMFQLEHQVNEVKNSLKTDRPIKYAVRAPITMKMPPGKLMGKTSDTITGYYQELASYCDLLVNYVVRQEGSVRTKALFSLVDPRGKTKSYTAEAPNTQIQMEAIQQFLHADISPEDIVTPDAQ